MMRTSQLFSLVASMIFLPRMGFCEPAQPAGSSQKPTAPKSIEQTGSLKQALDSIDDLKASFERHSKKKYSDCMKAFGSDVYCACVRDNSPVGIDFGAYIQIVTSSKDELKYDSLEEENKKLINKTLEVRDVCVQKIGKPQK